ncbi:RHS repeat-associated core domain-containing protein [Pseudomonas alloputida]|uniref:RHS repeat-associated core domain-containing protein n=1 Tax=Pseudomonas TaxID=286 RepID=UPI003EEF20BC
MRAHLLFLLVATMSLKENYPYYLNARHLKMNSKIFYFFAGARLKSVVQHQHSRTAFRHNQITLAELHSDLITPILFAIDSHGSPLRVGIPRESFGIAYTPYGLNTPFPIPILTGYNGEHLGPVGGLYLLGQRRIYNPVSMRFYSPDEYSPFSTDAGPNCYAYCGADPTNYTDPSGQMRRFFMRNHDVMWGSGTKVPWRYTSASSPLKRLTGKSSSNSLAKRSTSPVHISPYSMGTRHSVAEANLFQNIELYAQARKILPLIPLTKQQKKIPGFRHYQIEVLDLSFREEEWMHSFFKRHPTLKGTNEAFDIFEGTENFLGKLHDAMRQTRTR